MSSLFKSFKTDEKKEVEGIEIKYGPNDNGTIPTFRIRRRGDRNQEYAKMLQRETLPHQRAMEFGTMDEMLSRHILMKTFCRTVLLGWDNVLNQDDQLIPFSSENAIQLFTALPDLYTDLLTKSASAANFRADELEQERKN